MTVCGITAEYNPFHTGHLHHIAETRRSLGENAVIVCVMSGNFVQRGDFAVLDKYARAEMAVRCGADLVVELPLAAALSSAEWVVMMTGGSPARPRESVTKSHPLISSDSTACRCLRLRQDVLTTRASSFDTSSSFAVKPSKRMREDSALTAFFGQPTTVSMERSAGGIEMPRSFSMFSPS